MFWPIATAKIGDNDKAEQLYKELLTSQPYTPDIIVQHGSLALETEESR